MHLDLPVSSPTALQASTFLEPYEHIYWTCFPVSRFTGTYLQFRGTTTMEFNEAVGTWLHALLTSVLLNWNRGFDGAFFWCDIGIPDVRFWWYAQASKKPNTNQAVIKSMSHALAPVANKSPDRAQTKLVPDTRTSSETSGKKKKKLIYICTTLYFIWKQLPTWICNHMCVSLYPPFCQTIGGFQEQYDLLCINKPYSYLW